MSLDSLYSQLEATRRKVENNRNKIRRLNSAKRQVRQIKGNLSSRMRQFQRKGNSKDTYGSWSGEKRDYFQGYMSDTVISEYQLLIQAVDNRLDAICYEITELENENYRLNGVVGYLMSSINSIINAIETSVN